MYGFDLETMGYGGFQKGIGHFAVLALESKFMACLTEKDITVEARKKVLESLNSQVGSWSAKYGLDMKRLVLKELLTEAMSRVVSG